MAKRKKKKAKKAKLWRVERFLSFQAAGLLLFISLVLSNLQVWSISADTFILPMTSESLWNLLNFFGGYRFVLPTVTFHPYMAAVSFLSPITLILCAAIAYHALPGNITWRSLSAFAVGTLLFAYAEPGLISEELSFIFISLLCLLILVRRLPALFLWLLASLGVIFANTHFPVLWPILFWISLSLMLTSILHYLFLQKGALFKEQRKHLFKSLLITSAYLCLGLWVMLTFAGYALTDLSVSPSSHLWIPWVVALLSAYLTWRDPWKSTIYLRLTIFAQGLVFFNQFETIAWFSLAWLSYQALADFFQSAKVKALLSNNLGYLSNGTQITIVTGMVLLLGFQIQVPTPKRELDPGWASVLKDIQESDQKGFLVVGEGLPLLAQFNPSHFVRDENLILEDSQVRLIQKMKAKKVSSILVEKNYIKELWKKKIQAGLPAKKINESVLSRLVLYEGKAVKTSTLHLPPVIDFEINKLTHPDYAWVSMKER